MEQKTYAQLTPDGNLKYMPNPFEMSIANPDELTKEQLASRFGYYELVLADEPEYDSDTQYITPTYALIDGKIRQSWTINDLDPQTNSAE